MTSSSIYQPFTYLLKWSAQNKYYYGVRYAKYCSPKDLWTTYFTSSNRVKKFRAEFGEPDIIKITKIFSNREDAINWENRFLIKTNAIHNEKFLNRCRSKAIHPEDALRGSISKKPWKENDHRRELHSARMKEKNRDHINNTGLIKMNSPEIREKARLIRIKTYEKIRIESEQEKQTAKELHFKKSREIMKEVGKQAAIKLNSIKVICPVCGKMGQLGAMKRWHFDKCGQK